MNESSRPSVDFDSDDDSSSSSSSEEGLSSKQGRTCWNSETVSSRNPSEKSSGSKASSSFASFTASPKPDAAAVVSAENERQILLLMLLAQVCALHDPTPRTFTVHVLELYERGILDRDSIGFLFDLGLVPQRSPTSAFPQLEDGADVTDGTIQRRNALDPNHVRAREASAIRSRLEREDSMQSSNHRPFRRIDSEPLPTSWAVEHHPLSLSRYTREFKQVRHLSSGSFGSVFQATHKMDGRDYAVKRVVFSESGYSSQTVSQVVREVQCLAQCDHPNVVRYHASWLEPSWVTGSGTSVSNADEVASKQVQRRLLTDIHRMVNDSMGGLSDDESTRRDYSGSFDESSYNEISEWSRSQSRSNRSRVNDLQLTTWSGPNQQSPKKNSANRPSYRYQMCFFIQMQLCKPTTLLDWIRDRCQRQEGEHFGSAIDVFTQITKGLEHIHEAGIVHRDLKPANCILGEDGYFKVGDFGLSKVLRGKHGIPDDGSKTTALGTELVLMPSNTNNLNDWQESMTMGVGTASYCAPEQVNSNSYDCKADIFSLGLILLELFCTFGTEHERIQTFHLCRRGELPKKLQTKYPEVSRVILSCTKSSSIERPSARDLLSEPLLSRSNEKYQLEVQGLKGKLEEKDTQIKSQRTELEEKDRIIEELRQKMACLTNATQKSSDVPSVDALKNAPRDTEPAVKPPQNIVESESEADY